MRGTKNLAGDLCRTIARPLCGTLATPPTSHSTPGAILAESGGTWRFGPSKPLRASALLEPTVAPADLDPRSSPLHRKFGRQRGDVLGCAAACANSPTSGRATSFSDVKTTFVRTPCCPHSRTDIRGISDRGTGHICARPRVTMALRAAATFGRKSLQSSPNISPLVPSTFSRPLASWLIAPS